MAVTKQFSKNGCKNIDFSGDFYQENMFVNRRNHHKKLDFK